MNVNADLPALSHFLVGYDLALAPGVGEAFVRMRPDDQSRCEEGLRVGNVGSFQAALPRLNNTGAT